MARWEFLLCIDAFGPRARRACIRPAAVNIGNGTKSICVWLAFLSQRIDGYIVGVTCLIMALLFSRAYFFTLLCGIDTRCVHTYEASEFFFAIKKSKERGTGRRGHIRRDTCDRNYHISHSGIGGTPIANQIMFIMS